MTDSIDALLDRMRTDLAALAGPQRYFHAVYLRTTEAVAAEIERDGFTDGDWVRRWDLAFASLYLDALDADRSGGHVTQPWQIAFAAARDRPDLPPLQHVLLGLNAHINFDLPQALIAVINAEDFGDAAILRVRDADHRQVDFVLQSRVSAEDRELSAVSRVALLDRLLRPANRAASRRFLAEAREKVWHNARVLDRARRIGSYETTLGDLEELCGERVRDLVAPGPVLLKLAGRGFGVRLPG